MSSTPGEEHSSGPFTRAVRPVDGGMSRCGPTARPPSSPAVRRGSAGPGHATALDRFTRPAEFADCVAFVVGNAMINGGVARLDGAIRMAPR